MNRRDLLKLALAIPVIPTCQIVSEASIAKIIEPVKLDYTKLLNNGIEHIFEIINSDKDYVEFPVDLISPGYYESYTIDNLVKKYESETIKVSMCSSDFSRINEMAWHTLLAAVTDRNIAVYDADAEKGVLTKRLIKSMRETFRDCSNLKNLPNKFFVDESVEIEDKAEKYLEKVGSKLYRVNLNQYKKFYEKQLNATFCKHKSSFIIGVGEPDCVIPVYKDRYGMVVLKNEQCLMGHV